MNVFASKLPAPALCLIAWVLSANVFGARSQSLEDPSPTHTSPPPGNQNEQAATGMQIVPTTATAIPNSLNEEESANPVGVFKHLLEASKEERDEWLSNQEEWRQERIREGLAEFERLAPAEREQRLRAMELRFYLLPLLKLNENERAPAFSLVPQHLRNQANDHLKHWDLLPETARNEALARETWRKKRPTSKVADIAPLPPTGSLQTWNHLSTEEKEKIRRNFQGFFSLPPDEQRKTLSMLDSHQVRELESILTKVNDRSVEDRKKLVEYFIRFAKMSPLERGGFIQKASTWQKMTAEERDLWKEIVRKNPPMPPINR